MGHRPQTQGLAPHVSPQPTPQPQPGSTPQPTSQPQPGSQPPQQSGPVQTLIRGRAGPQPQSPHQSWPAIDRPSQPHESQQPTSHPQPGSTAHPGSQPQPTSQPGSTAQPTSQPQTVATPQPQPGRSAMQPEAPATARATTATRDSKREVLRAIPVKLPLRGSPPAFPAGDDVMTSNAHAADGLRSVSGIGASGGRVESNRQGRRSFADATRPSPPGGKLGRVGVASKARRRAGDVSRRSAVAAAVNLVVHSGR